MNTKKGFKRLTWVISVLAAMSTGAILIDYPLLEALSTTFVAFVSVWLIYWIINWIIKGFKDTE